MHFGFENTLRDSTKRISEESKVGQLEAALELKVSKIRAAFDKMETLARVQSADVTQSDEAQNKLTTLFELNRPSIAHDILDAKNLLLEVKLKTQNGAHQPLSRTLADRKFELELIHDLEQDLQAFEAKLMNKDLLEPVS